MDLRVIESGNGGELVKNPRDFEIVRSFENMPYLAMFGGNLKASTPSRRLENEQAFDWWGNNLLFDNDSSRQFNSETERVLNSVSLTSSGRVLIEQAVKRDLEFMKPFAEVSVSVSIPTVDKVVIAITLKEPGNLKDKKFMYIWDAARNEIGYADNFSTVITGKIFDFSFDETFE